MIRTLATFLMMLLVSVTLMAQTGEIRGRITDTEKQEPLVGATVTLVGTKLGATTDANGSFVVSGVTPGTYTLRCAYVGYVTAQRRVTVGAQPVTVDIALEVTMIQSSEVIVEVNRAKERETPVAFSNVEKMDIEAKIHGQDAPLLTLGTPGVYAYGTDGTANGEARLFVRGFNQNYVQVLINGVPTNDPESNSVYWSNWGSVSSAAQSIQIQRGAGSSLYGAGSFGGSFNIITAEAPAKPSYGVQATFGSPLSTMYGVNLNSGLIDEKFAASLRVDRKIAEGSRVSGRYEGINYYMSLAWYINPQQSLKFVLHGAPQEHGYSWSSDISYFKRYGYDANGAPFLPKPVTQELPVDPNTGLNSYGLLDDSRELVDSRYVNLSHNFFHKPQAELHYRYDLNPVSSIGATFFYSMGRGGGSSLNNTGTVFSRASDNSVTDRLGAYGEDDGVIADYNTAKNIYLGGNALQRISYSLHQQWGILANYTTRPVEWMNVTVGGEYRRWTADHPGHFTNLFGKTSATWSYARLDTAGKVMSSTFSRRVYQGDLDGPSKDIGLGDLFDWNMANGIDPTYRSQYRNYRGETPQYTLFGQFTFEVGKLNIAASLQYAWYQYKLLENMPSENAIGRMLTRAEEAGRGSALVEGPTGNGKFLMKDNASSAPRWYEFTLVNETRSRGFWQPKGGVNFNATDNLNLFANYAHVERFVDLGVYYNQGRVNPSVEDEKSDQLEGGIGWISDYLIAKLNGYYMEWKNKSASIRDASKAGEPGYDRNGNRSELVGTSKHQGVEFEMRIPFERTLDVKGLEAVGMFTWMENTWKEVLPSVLTDPLTGQRRAFNTGAVDQSGQRDTLYFEELPGTPVASGPQTMMMLGLNYRSTSFFAGINWNYHARHFSLDGGSYLAIDGVYSAATINGKTYFEPKYSRTLQPYSTVNVFFGVPDIHVGGLSTMASVQVFNLFGSEFLSDADRNGVYPGLGTTIRFNVSAAL